MRFTVRHGLGRARLLAITGIVAILAGVTLGAIGTAGADEAPLDTTDPTTEVTPPTDPPAETPADTPADTPAEEPADPPSDESVQPLTVQSFNVPSDDIGALKANNGTIKIHETGTPSGTEDNDPKVCSFDVEGFGFDEGQSGVLDFEVQGNDAPHGTDLLGVPFGPADASGYMISATISLDPGHYKATFTDLDGNKFKSKVFKVQCEELSTPTVTSEVHNANHDDITNTSVPAGTEVHDKAIVAGIENGDVPTGSVDFRFFENDECSDEPLDAQTVGLTEDNGEAVAESTPRTPGVGSFSYRVHYLGDDVYEPGDGPCEPFGITEVEGRDTPTVTSEVHNSSHDDITNTTVPAGTTVHDKAIVAGIQNGDVPTGSVDFRFFNNGDCTGEPSDTESDVALSEENGNAVAESTPQTPSLGAKAYQVHYNGDEEYTEGLGPCEPFDPSGTSTEPPLTPPEVGGVAVTEAATGTLPFTGGGPGWQLPVGVLFVLGGALLLLVTRPRRTADLGS